MLDPTIRATLKDFVYEPRFFFRDIILLTTTQATNGPIIKAEHIFNS